MTDEPRESRLVTLEKREGQRAQTSTISTTPAMAASFDRLNPGLLAGGISPDFLWGGLLLISLHDGDKTGGMRIAARGRVTLIDFLILLLIAGICGAIGQAITGYSHGGCLVS